MKTPRNSKCLVVRVKTPQRERQEGDDNCGGRSLQEAARQRAAQERIARLEQTLVAPRRPSFPTPAAGTAGCNSSTFVG